MNCAVVRRYWVVCTDVGAACKTAVVSGIIAASKTAVATIDDYSQN